MNCQYWLWKAKIWRTIAEDWILAAKDLMVIHYEQVVVNDKLSFSSREEWPCWQKWLHPDEIGPNIFLLVVTVGCGTEQNNRGGACLLEVAPWGKEKRLPSFCQVVRLWFSHLWVLFLSCITLFYRTWVRSLAMLVTHWLTNWLTNCCLVNLMLAWYQLLDDVATAT